MIEEAFAPVRAAVEAGTIPGAALGVVRADGRREVVWAGLARRVPDAEALTRQHWFDLASLTKVIATTPAILALAEQGRIDLDGPLTQAIPDLRQYDAAGAPERRLTFRDCLAHRTFLPAVYPLYTLGDDPARLKAWVLQNEWPHGPPVYSDINFILLGIAIERLTGRPLAALGLGEGLSYTPEGVAVATEACPWRGRVLVGEVHDENAFALGGAAGHAGLFGTIDGLLDFAQALLDPVATPLQYRCKLLDRVHENRTLGWERAHSGWHGGGLCSDRTIGHTGFTGTGLWVDFERGIAWTLLTNRIHPSRHSIDANAIFALRPAVGERVR